ncbi:MAG: D-alanine--D-alanine ligase [Woeseia sp.]
MSDVAGRIEIVDPAEFGRVAVLLGGRSSERNVSLDSGAAVLRALKARGIDAEPWDPAKKGFREFANAGFDRTWIALHGADGEDGALQGALEWLDMPYTGSGVMASAVAMDKICSKHLFAAAGIPTPDYHVIREPRAARLAADEFGFPLILKPSREGSSVGMSKVFEIDELDAAAELALSFNAPAIIERCIVGEEYTVSILQGIALPSIRIETPRVFYDYRAKYESDRTQYFCPGNPDAETEAMYAELALRAFDELGCSGWGRVDFMTGKDGEPQVLEINTVPGMTSHSLVPMAAKACGIDFAELCWRILETSMAASAAEAIREVASHGT